MVITKTSLPRRTFLRGVGATLALPLLDAMVPALATAAPAIIRRFGAIYVPNGMNLSQWTPRAEGAGFEFSPSLSSLKPFRDRINVLSGLDSDPGESWGRGNGDHARVQPAWLAATHPKKTEAVIRCGTTLDQIIAREQGGDTPLRSLEVQLERSDLTSPGVGGYSPVYGQTIAWRTPTTPLPMDNNPRIVFERMFGEGSTAAKRLAQLQLNRSILDSIPAEIASLQKALGPGDRHRVDEYLYSVRETERRIQLAEQQSANRVIPIDRPDGAPAEWEEHCRLMFDLVALALQTDVTRVFTFLVGQEFSQQTFPQIGIPDAHHSISHHQGNPETLMKVAKVDQYRTEQVAYFLDKLKNLPDGDGTLLDNSLVVYGAGFSDGNTHAHINLPIVVAGGAGGRVKGGRHIRYPKGTPMANLLVSMSNAMGVPLDSIGDSTGRLTGFADGGV